MADNKLRVGALVRFLSSVGGGRVARISGDTAWVADEDGFEIPTLIRECVVVEENDGFAPAYKPPVSPEVQQIMNQKKLQIPKASEPAPKPTEPERLPHTYLPGNDRLNACLAYLPIDERQLGTTPYELFLINDSNYSLCYTYSSIDESGRAYLRARGEVGPNTKLFVEEFTPSELNNLERIHVQLLAYDEKAFRPIEPMTIEHRLDGRKFLKLHSFVENDFFDEGALIYPLATEGKPYAPQALKGEDIARAMKGERRAPQPAHREARGVGATPTANEPLVIDLHIEELLDSTAGMGNAEILSYQVEKFHEVMKANLKYRGKKLVFIHGKGEGVLRSAIERELKHKYKGCRYQDASFREYSYGATQVTIG